MSDWDLYSALRYQDDWKQKRADKQMELQLIEKQEQIAQQDMQTQAQMEAGLVDYMNKVKEMNILAKDQEKVNQIELEERARVISGISKYNGDLKRYMMSGGISQLNNYKNAIVNSETTKRAQINKVNYDAALKAKQEGKHLAPAFVRYRGDNGETVEGLATFDQQMVLFEQNRLDNIGFAGAVEKIKIDPNVFMKNVKNPNNPYKSEMVTAEDVRKLAVMQGAPDWYADELAMDYMRSGQTWQWGALDPLDAQVKMAKIRESNANAAAASASMYSPVGSITTGQDLTPGRPVTVGNFQANSMTFNHPKLRQAWLGSLFNVDSNGALSTNSKGEYAGTGVGVRVFNPTTGGYVHVDNFTPNVYGVNGNEVFFINGKPHMRVSGTAEGEADNMDKFGSNWSRDWKGHLDYYGNQWDPTGITADNLMLKDVFIEVEYNPAAEVLSAKDVNASTSKFGAATSVNTLNERAFTNIGNWTGGN